MEKIVPLSNQLVTRNGLNKLCAVFEGKNFKIFNIG